MRGNVSGAQLASVSAPRVISRGKDYGEHCGKGGHPSPEGIHLLPDHRSPEASAAFWWCDLAIHGSSVWSYSLAAAKRLEIDGMLAEIEPAQSLVALEREWRDRDPFLAIARRLEPPRRARWHPCSDSGRTQNQIATDHGAELPLSPAKQFTDVERHFHGITCMAAPRTRKFPGILTVRPDEFSMKSIDVEGAAGRPFRSMAPPQHPIIEITPSVEQYRQLVRDLAKLRKAGAPSNTAAIVDAIHRAAGGDKVDGD